MAGPARTGVLVYAKDVARVARFYERVLGARVVVADPEHTVLQSPDVQLIIHALPAEAAARVVVTSPPEPRLAQAVKPFFTVAGLADAERIAEECGGRAWGPVYPGPGLRVRNVCDPEGNVVHLRERVG